MSTEIEFTDPNESETDEAVDTFEESEIADPFATAPEDDAPEEEVAQEEDTPEEDTPEEDTPEEDTPEEDTPEEDTPEEDTPEEDTPEEDSDQEEIFHPALPEDQDKDEDPDEDDEVDTSMGEWSLCASMIFLAGYLVVLLFWILDHSVWETLISFDTEVYRTEFPVGVATIILLISVLSAFCSFISLVADKNNRKTLLIRLLTLGPLLPTATAGFMIWIIIQRGAGNSILENFLG